MFNSMFDELKEVQRNNTEFKSLVVTPFSIKYLKEIKRLKSLWKAEAYLEPKRVSTMELFREHTERLTIFAIKAPS